jgi:hypothetical protein
VGWERRRTGEKERRRGTPEKGAERRVRREGKICSSEETEW